MKKVLFLSLLILLSFQVKATHVVGGNFVVTQTGANTFTVVCKVYRDCAPGNAGMPTSLTVGIYYKQNNVLYQSITMSTPVISTITLGDNCYTPAGICLQEGVFTYNNLTIPNNAAGYYIETELYARNNIIVNLSNPGSQGMSFYAEIPDPAITGMNSSPDFGPYPSDGYFCVNNQKQLDFSVVDADGDSLAYSLVEPLGSNLSGNGTSPAPYSPVIWAGGYSAANMVGGTPPMSCDPITGIVTAAPTAMGTFVFAVRIEEFRNGVKIGEVRRDVQYHSLNCVFDDLPEIMLPDTLEITVGSTGCFDIVVIDEDADDTISIFVTSPTFLEGAALGMPPVPYQTSPDTTYQFFFFNENSNVNDSVVLPEPTYVNGAYYGVGGIGLQYCWQTQCPDILNNPYVLEVEAFSLGCSGDTNFVSQVIELNIVQDPPPIEEIIMPDTISVVARESSCFDVVIVSSHPEDTVVLYANNNSLSENFALSYSNPVSTNPVLYEFSYLDQSTNTIETVILPPAYINSNGDYEGIGGIGLRYCWITSCDEISEIQYDFITSAFKVGCFGDTTFVRDTAHILIHPPYYPYFDKVPNVFTPNNDGLNDKYKIGGISNYCYDTISIQIYNRWGKMVYESFDPEFEWDGKDIQGQIVSEGTYYVILNGIFGDADVTSRYTLTLLRQK